MKSIHPLHCGLLLLLLTLGTALLGQGYEPIATGMARVVSLDGLILRAGPGKDQKRVDAIPYGTVVEVVASARPKRDSLSPMRYNFTGDDTTETYQISRVGYWAKVKWNGKVGFALDIFLVSEDEEYNSPSEILDRELPAYINSDFLLIEAGTACQTNLPPDPRYHWYGVYRRGDKLQIQSVSLRLHAYRKDEVVPGQFFLHSLADDNMGLEYIIGTRTPMGDARFTDLLHAHGMEHEGEPTPAQQAAYFQRLGLSFESNEGNEFKEMRLRLGINGVEQLLEMPEIDRNGEPWLRLVADLDGDGKPDYVVTFGENSSVTVLYLSSRAPKGKLVQPVAFWFSSYCC